VHSQAAFRRHERGRLSWWTASLSAGDPDGTRTRDLRRDRAAR
jgi:hypothetical protein